MILDMTSELFCILFFSLSFLGYVIYSVKKQIQIRYWVVPAFVVYVLYVIKVTIFPIFIFDQETLSNIKEGVGEYFKFYQLRPFASIINYFNQGALIQLLGNILLLAPMVFFVEVFTKGKKNWKKVILFTSLLSFLIELVQLIINYSTGHPSRVADVDDLIINITGIIISFVCLRFLEKVIRNNLAISKIVKKIFYKS